MSELSLTAVRKELYIDNHVKTALPYSETPVCTLGGGKTERRRKYGLANPTSCFQRAAFPEPHAGITSPVSFKDGYQNFHIKFILCLIGQLLKCKKKLCFSGVEKCLLLMENVFFSFW